MMMRLLGLIAAALAAGLHGAPTLAQPQFNESPIAPGFWSFPSHKAVTAQEVAVVCRNNFGIRFADGHFLGVSLRKTEKGLVQREIEEVGRCTFNRETQIDHCEVRQIHPDGSILAGTTDNRYSSDAHKLLKMTVTPKMITDSPSDNAPFDAFPVRCPDDTVWSILNESSPPK